MNSIDTRHSAKIPVTILTGFLGSGKTTLLNHLVRQPAMRATAVIINEFGEIGIDHLLVETSTEMMIELNNGCICCTIRGDLADKLGSLAMWLDTDRIAPVDRVVVETTGLADPSPIMHTLMVEPDLLARYRIDRVVTVVDAISGASALDRFPEATKQIAMADVLMVAKTDLVGTLSNADALANLEARIRTINPRAPVYKTVGGVIDPALCFDGSDEADPLVHFRRAADADAACEHDDERTHGHDHSSAGIASFVVELAEAVDREQLNGLLQELGAEFGRHLLRVKGLVHVAGSPQTPAVIHGVQHIFFPVSWLDRWPNDDRASRLVFITQNLAADVVKDRFRARLS
jgi:G3E family GTPase